MPAGRCIRRRLNCATARIPRPFPDGHDDVCYFERFARVALIGRDIFGETVRLARPTLVSHTTLRRPIFARYADENANGSRVYVAFRRLPVHFKIFFLSSNRLYCPVESYGRTNTNDCYPNARGQQSNTHGIRRTSENDAFRKYVRIHYALRMIFNVHL